MYRIPNICCLELGSYAGLRIQAATLQGMRLVAGMAFLDYFKIERTETTCNFWQSRR
jgi:hypothetical protein